MLTQSVMRRALATAFTLGVTATAFARNPPALERAHARTEHAVACEGAMVREGAGYRDSNTRLARAQTTSARVAVAAAGYRDAIRRFAPTQGAMVACTTSTRSASR